MRLPNHIPSSPRTLGALVSAATLAVPLLLAAALPGRADALVPVALVLPLLTMGALDAALRHDRHSRS